MKHVGKIDCDSTKCGFTVIEDDEDNACNQPVIIHAIMENTWEGYSYAVACDNHASILQRVSDYHHDIEPPCHDLSARFLIRTNGSSFCYQPEDDAALMARIAQPDIALIGPAK